MTQIDDVEYDFNLGLEFRSGPVW